MSKSSYVVELRQGTKALGATMAATARASGAGQAHSIQIKWIGISGAKARDIDRDIATKLPSELKRQLDLSDMPIVTTTTTAAGGTRSNNNKMWYYLGPILGAAGLALIAVAIYFMCVSSSTRSSRDYDTDESDLESEWEQDAESKDAKPDPEASAAPILPPEFQSPEAA